MTQVLRWVDDATFRGAPLAPQSSARALSSGAKTTQAWA